jgi:hypothetical protein
MNDWLLCAYALSVIGLSIAGAGTAGYWIGRWREQRSLLEMLRPEK